MYKADNDGVIRIHGMDAILKAMEDDKLLQIGGNNDKQIGEFVFKQKPENVEEVKQTADPVVVEHKPIKKGKKKNVKKDS